MHYFYVSNYLSLLYFYSTKCFQLFLNYNSITSVFKVSCMVNSIDTSCNKTFLVKVKLNKRQISWQYFLRFLCFLILFLFDSWVKVVYVEVYKALVAYNVECIFYMKCFVNFTSLLVFYNFVWISFDQFAYY